MTLPLQLLFVSFGLFVSVNCGASILAKDVSSFDLCQSLQEWQHFLEAQPVYLTLINENNQELDWFASKDLTLQVFPLVVVGLKKLIGSIKFDFFQVIDPSSPSFETTLTDADFAAADQTGRADLVSLGKDV